LPSRKSTLHQRGAWVMDLVWPGAVFQIDGPVRLVFFNDFCFHIASEFD
jgi:hypothetical protein